MLPSVLIVAPHASAQFGGEAILPLQYFRFLRARGVQVRMVVHERVRPELEATLGPDADRVSYVADRPIHRFIWGLRRFMPRRLHEVTGQPLLETLTLWEQRLLARRLIREHGIQVVHQPTPVSPRSPSMLWGMGVPVVIGPLNGGMSYPPRMSWLESRPERLLVGVGRIGSSLLNLALPGKRRAAVVLVANERTRRALPAGIRGRVAVLVENGVDRALFEAQTRAPAPANGFRLVYIGRLVPLKAVDLALEALARVDGAVSFDIIGDGEARSALEARAAELGLTERVTFHGFIPQRECPAILDRAGALVLPSLHECGGAVVLEAMAMGKPVIATRWGGPLDYLDDSTGILVDPAGRKPFVADLTAAMQTLADSPELCRRLGAAARDRVRERFDWERKIDAMLEVYRSVLPADGPG